MKYYFKVMHQYQFDALIALAINKDLVICETYLDEGPFKWPIFILDTESEINILGGHSANSDLISFEKMIELIQKGPLSFIELTKEYNAYVNKEKQIVKVGCQEIPFSKVKELYNLINKN